jgi:hypothetical protein
MPVKELFLAREVLRRIHPGSKEAAQIRQSNANEAID